jgi:endonuclease G
MKKLLVTLLLAFISVYSQAWEQREPLPLKDCKIHSPYGLADTKRDLTPICREGYLVAYDPEAKIPAYVAYTLQPKNALGCIARTNAFVADKSIKNGPRPDDYAGTGYDKGHVSPDGDLSWDQQVEYESFLMTNMVPQAGSLNRGIWKLLETSVRGWAVQLNSPYTIFGGGIYNDDDKKIGNGVVVPHAYYKIVINNQTKEFAGWLFPHVPPYPNLGNDLTKYRAMVSSIQSKSGIKFDLPKGGKEITPGDEWAVNFGELTKAKRAKCGKSAD